jgi:hypothetical protein
MDGAAPRWMMLTFGAARLALPASAVLGVVALDSLRRDGPAPGAVGRLAVGDQACDAFALDEDFAVVLQIAPERRACAMIGDGAAAFALVCDEAHLLQPKAARRFALPSAMRHGASPVTDLLFAGDTMLPLVSAATLMRLLGLAPAAVLPRIHA